MNKTINMANEMQVGDSHYKTLKYQPWDFICDTELHYLLACSVKHIVGWRNKKGVPDLLNAVHYLEKAKEKGISPLLDISITHDQTIEFIKPLDIRDGAIIMSIMLDDYDNAIKDINRLIEKKSNDQKPEFKSNKQFPGNKLKRVVGGNENLAKKYADFMCVTFNEDWQKAYDHKLYQLEK